MYLANNKAHHSEHFFRLKDTTVLYQNYPEGYAIHEMVISINLHI